MMFRFLLLALCLVVSQALMLTPGASALHKPLAGPRMGIINENIDKDSPKVATMQKVSEIKGKKGVFCRCWKSGTFPLCNGAHMAHNEETGDNVGPLIIDKSD
uniref:Iron-binding zinc finger CDGSH type domain-containing protein n=1 Tax=Haptolina ericina TaxID=156174 RepID=A0A7S3C0S7_9EUKA|mmetsp:Transcript_71841/g.159759  ORF Transcript_71841/g.159759 Transcript_71841/m.159759 type:complete len:103 (+) Transcript_71841:38-346(+)